MRTTPTILAFAASAVFALATTLGGEARADSKSEAEQSFREGRALLAAGELERACAKFAESQRQDPAAGTLLNLGECQDRRGLAASARATYLEAAKAAALRGRSDWEKLASSRAAALEKDVSIVVIVVEPTNARLKDLTITRDGVKEDWNKPIPVDPGAHTIEATAPGHRSWSTKVSVGKANALKVEVPKLEEAFADGATGTLPTSPTPPVNPDARSDDGGANQRMLGIVLGGVGAVGVVVGGITAVLAKGKYDDAVRLCPSYPDHCPADGSGTAANDSAKTFAAVSTISFIAGGVCLIGGAALYFTAPTSQPQPQPQSQPPKAAAGLRITPTVTTTNITLDVTGRF